MPVSAKERQRKCRLRKKQREEEERREQEQQDREEQIKKELQKEKNRLYQQKCRQNKKLRAQATMSDTAPMPLGAAAKPNDNESTALPNPARGPYPEQRLVLTSQQQIEFLRESRLRASASNNRHMDRLVSVHRDTMTNMAATAQSEKAEEAEYLDLVLNAAIMDVGNNGVPKSQSTSSSGSREVDSAGESLRTVQD